MTLIQTSDLALTITDQGDGAPVLVLHGGGGPATMLTWAAQVATLLPARVITPTHPGFGGTPRPDALDSIGGLARLYAGLLDTLDLHDVTVVGNSIGGWIAAEMAVLAPSRVGRYVLVDAVGLEVPGHPVADFFSLTFPELADLSYHDPAGFVIDPSAMSPEALAVMSGNRAALEVYTGRSMTDPTLGGRLAPVRTPLDVVWGEADRIVDPAVGRAYAAAVPGASFTLIPASGHLPQLETPGALTDVVRIALDRAGVTPR